VVLVQRSAGRGWKTVARLRTDRFGLFSKRLGGRLDGSLRAVLDRRDASVPFALKRPPDMQVWPFGCGGILPCS
jgi:hypothetical protein